MEKLERAVSAIIDSDKVPVRFLRPGVELGRGVRPRVGEIVYLTRDHAAALCKNGAANLAEGD